LLSAALLGAALLPAGQGVCRAEDCKHCPPPYYHCQEAPPCIKFMHACPRPVCPPCNSDFFGYYPTCWRIWPAGQSNCPVTQPPWVPVPPSFATPANPFGLHALAGAVLPAPEAVGTETSPAPRPTPIPPPAPESHTNPPAVPAPELKPVPPVTLAPVEPRLTLPVTPTPVEPPPNPPPTPAPVEPVSPHSESNLWHPARRPQQDLKQIVPAKLELESEVSEVPPPPPRPW
jgi:hypothetical protein